MYYIGIDGGASSTRCLIADNFGEVITYIVGEPSGHPYTREGRQALRKALQKTLGTALEENPQILAIGCAAICLGLTGIFFGRAGQKTQELISSYVNSMVPCDRVSVRNDMEIALKGASVSGMGIVVYAGTGSHAYGIDYSGDSANAGGWGYLFGDDGAAYGIGRDVLRAAFRSHDDSRTSTALLEKLYRRFETDDPQEIRVSLFGAGSSAVRLVASLAKLASEAAEEGDAIAIQILTKAGEELAVIAESVVRKLRLLNEEVDVFTCGGTFTAHCILSQAFRNRLLQLVPRASIIKPRFAPVIGALLMAWEECGVSITPEWINILEHAQQERQIA
jgi:N-acetylglucosamine kinase